jgi:hypothetical protein
MENMTTIMPSIVLYEYRGEIKLPENDTLAWLDEEMGDSHEARCSVNSID